MAVRLRLVRMGKKKQPTYRVVAADKRSPRNGKFIEIIGTYEPRRDPSIVNIDNERAVHWLQHGAQPSERVEKLLKLCGAWDEFKGNAPGSSGTLTEQPPKAVRPVAAAPEASAAAPAKPPKATPKAKEPKAKEPKVEEPKVEEPKAEEPKVEEPKAEESEAEAPKAEATVEADEPKAEAVASEETESADGAEADASESNEEST